MISPLNSDKIVMWLILRNRRLILRLYNFQGSRILGASRGHLCDSVIFSLLLLFGGLYRFK